MKIKKSQQLYRTRESEIEIGTRKRENVRKCKQFYSKIKKTDYY